ncbi:MAG: hypothetical protein K9K75_04570 [Deltaproteobacteria bacterium]|nr:hypothetical protein [Deltaproteobacteria bacterium]
MAERRKLKIKNRDFVISTEGRNRLEVGMARKFVVGVEGIPRFARNDRKKKIENRNRRFVILNVVKNRLEVGMARKFVVGVEGIPRFARNDKKEE